MVSRLTRQAAPHSPPPSSPTRRTSHATEKHTLCLAPSALVTVSLLSSFSFQLLHRASSSLPRRSRSLSRSLSSLSLSSRARLSSLYSTLSLRSTLSLSLSLSSLCPLSSLYSLSLSLSLSLSRLSSRRPVVSSKLCVLSFLSLPLLAPPYRLLSGDRELRVSSLPRSRLSLFSLSRSLSLSRLSLSKLLSLLSLPSLSRRASLSRPAPTALSLSLSLSLSPSLSLLLSRLDRDSSPSFLRVARSLSSGASLLSSLRLSLLSSRLSLSRSLSRSLLPLSLNLCKRPVSRRRA